MSEKLLKFMPKFVSAFFLVIILFGVYVKIWEWRQEKFELKNVLIKIIIPYYASGGDLHWSFKGFRIYVDSDNRPIDFPEKNWNSTIQIGDSVIIIARKSFFFDELDGLNIHKVN